MLQREDDLSQLMRTANRGDAAAYRRVLDGLAPMVRTIARRELRRFGRGPEDAEDVVQEVLLAVHLKRHTWDEGQPIEPWVRAIANYKTIDVLRRRRFREHLPIDDVHESDLVAVVPRGTEALESADLLASLPERQRQIVQGVAVEGWSAREMGDRLGMNEGAVRVSLHRALKVLAAAMDRDER